MYVIEPAKTGSVSTVDVAPKKDGSSWFRGDYRKHSAVAFCASYLIPRMDEQLDFLGVARVFPTFAANSDYWQSEVDASDREETAFTSLHRLYPSTCMPICLKNSPVAFHYVLDIIPSSVNCQFALVFPETIVIFWQTPCKHISRLRLVLSLLKKSDVTLNLRKCTFFTNMIHYSLHFPSGRLEVASHTTDDICDLNTPTTETKLRSCVWLYNVLRRFVPSFSYSWCQLVAGFHKSMEEELGKLT